MMLEDDIKLTDEERQPCERWSRVMGYYRPVDAWNIGKTQEHKDRQHYDEKTLTQYAEEDHRA